MEGKCCKGTAIASVAIIVYAWLFDIVVHGKLFAQLYIETADLWRPESQMAEFFPYCAAYHVIVAFLVTNGYFCWRDVVKTGKVGGADCPYRKSLYFGLWLGSILGISAATTYIFLPMPGELALVWMVSNIAKWGIAGLLLQKLYEWKVKCDPKPVKKSNGKTKK